MVLRPITQPFWCYKLQIIQNKKQNKSHYKKFSSLTMQPKITSRPSTSKSNSLHDTSRLSLASSLATVNTNKYPKCEIKKQHNKELLNLICLSEGCKGRGPICAICKINEHSSHMVIPVKKFLEHVQACLNKKAQPDTTIQKNIMKTEPIAILEQEQHQGQTLMTEEAEKNEQKALQVQQNQSQKQIQDILLLKQKMLHCLGLHINVIAEQIRRIEQKIITDTQKSIEQIKNVASLQKNLKNILNQLKEQQFSDSVFYKNRVLTLLNMVKYKSKEECQISKDGSAKAYEDTIKMGQNFIANIDEWQSQSIKMLGKVFQPNPNIKNSVQKDKEELPSTHFKFSSEMKIKSIILSNDHKTARLNEKLPGLALSIGPLLKQKKIKLKIVNVSNAVMVGVGLKDIIKENHFKLNSSAIGHGTYMVSHNMYTYSHHNKGNNMSMKGLSFTSGEQITISLKGESVSFIKKTEPKSVSLQMKKLTQEEWKQLVVCVFLGGIGDKVEFIQ